MVFPYQNCMQTVEVPVRQSQESSAALTRNDLLAVEEPLEIRLGFVRENKRTHQSISITMRTPGNDFDLAAGFLFTEGIITSADQIEAIEHCGKPAPGSQLRNTVRVDLKPDIAVDLKRLERHFYTSSSCGVCGKTSIEALQTISCPARSLDNLQVDAQMIHRLPELLHNAQSVFNQTGGLHAAALFDADGQLIALREDVGRHNALDKLIGSRLMMRNIPLPQSLLLVSGRASFELVQKSVVAGIPIMAAVGAPSSLAVRLAQEYAMTLLGFVRDGRFNIYSNEGRIRFA
jgi:FdhD protein